MCTASVPRQHLRHPAPLGSYHLLIETSGGYLPRDWGGHEMENKVGGRQEGGGLRSAVFQGETPARGFPLGEGRTAFELGDTEWRGWLVWEGGFPLTLCRCTRAGPFRQRQPSTSRTLVARASDGAQPRRISQQFPPLFRVAGIWTRSRPAAVVL